MNRQALVPAGAPAEAFTEQNDYAAALLQRCAAENRIPAETLRTLRDGLHRAAGELAAAYTRGKSCTVTRTQAEAFYRSVFYQLDAALLPLRSDAAAVTALCSQPLDRLLQAGQTRILALYAQAKADFRRAYQLTEPFATMFFRSLLPQFADFTTKYDVRFQHDAFSPDGDYPLLGERQIPLKGVLGMAEYYRALLHEGELIRLFPADALHEIMRSYAAKFRTEPEMIAENIAELAVRQWLTAVLAGEPEAGMCLTVRAADADAVTAEYAGMPAEKLLRDAENAVQTHLAAHAGAECIAYLKAALPNLTAEMHRRITDGNLSAWLTMSSPSQES